MLYSYIIKTETRVVFFLIQQHINHNHMEYFYKPWSITNKSKYWGMQTHKKRPGRVAVPAKFYCINFVYLHRPPTCI